MNPVRESLDSEMSLILDLKRVVEERRCLKQKYTSGQYFETMCKAYVQSQVIEIEHYTVTLRRGNSSKNLIKTMR